jgi:hypothetical protein
MRDGVSAPLMSVGTKMENVSEDYRNLRETVTDLASRTGKHNAKMTVLGLFPHPRDLLTKFAGSRDGAPPKQL